MTLTSGSGSVARNLVTGGGDQTLPYSAVVAHLRIIRRGHVICIRGTEPY
jgi:hypothetical protein